MKDYVSEAMEAGALGLSTGLYYPPGWFAKTDEIIELCKVVAKYKGYYYSHIRSYAGALIKAINEAIEDAGLQTEDVSYVNAHGTSTQKGDKIEIDCLRKIFGKKLESLPVSSNKSQIGHTLGASAAIEAALGIEAMQKGLILPTVNHISDPELADIDVVPNKVRRQNYETFLSNAFGFGGTNCCIVFKGV